MVQRWKKLKKKVFFITFVIQLKDQKTFNLTSFSLEKMKIAIIFPQLIWQFEKLIHSSYLSAKIVNCETEFNSTLQKQKTLK